MRQTSSSTLLLRILIISFIATLVTACNRIDSDSEKDREMRTRAVLSVIGAALDSWKATKGRLPSTEEGLSKLGLKSKTPVDGWGFPVRYKLSGVGSPSDFLLYSIGRDGVDSGGSGDDVTWRRGKW